MWSFIILLAARVCSDWFSTTSSLLTENPLSTEACPCDKSNASSQTDHTLGQLAAILLRRNVSRQSSATEKFSNSPFAHAWMKSSNCCNKYVTVRHSSHTTTANSMVDWTPARLLLALQQLYKKVKFFRKFPWLSSHFCIFPDFPWPLKFPDLFQFSLTCRNPASLWTGLKTNKAVWITKDRHRWYNVLFTTDLSGGWD